jgi:hypothetical protein
MTVEHTVPETGTPGAAKKMELPVSVESLQLGSVDGVEGPKAPAGCGAEPRSRSAYGGSCSGRFHPPFVVNW